MGTTVESIIAARPPYSLSFRHLEDINQCNWDIEKGINILMLATLDFKLINFLFVINHCTPHSLL